MQGVVVKVRREPDDSCVSVQLTAFHAGSSRPQTQGWIGALPLLERLTATIAGARVELSRETQTLTIYFVEGVTGAELKIAADAAEVEILRFISEEPGWFRETASGSC